MRSALDMPDSTQLDPVAEFLGLSISKDTQDDAEVMERSLKGLQKLAQKYEWAAVIELGTTLLSQDDESKDEEVKMFTKDDRLVCEAYRGLAYLQMGQVNKASEVVDRCGIGNIKIIDGDEWDIVDGSKCGEGEESLPFEMEMLALEVGVRQGRPNAVMECYKTLRTCRHEAENLGKSLHDKEVWTRREFWVLSVIVGFRLRNGQYESAVDVTRELVALYGHKSDVLHLYARVLIHVGDYELAKNVLQQAGRCADSKVSQHHLHSGLLFGAIGEFRKAIREYDFVRSLRAGGECAASANKASCLVHLGELTEAIRVLEIALQENPVQALDEGIVANMCALYELAYPVEAEAKKSILRKAVSRHGRQGFLIGVIK